MIISIAPVRLSMGGGGTDLASYYTKFGGFLMATTINKYVYIYLNKRFGNTTRLSYSQTEIVKDITEIEHNIFREALLMSGITENVELGSIADVPSNCGLGTSSTFTVALLNSLYTYKKDYLSLREIAEKACKLEIDILNAPIGKQDQYAATFGGFNAYWFNKDGTVDIEPVRIKEEDLMDLQSNIFLFYLNKQRSANELLKSQNDKSIKGDNKTIERLNKIKQIGIETKEIFEKGKLDQFGEILHEHWLVKRQLSENISNSFIDEAYNQAIKNGALGGKIVGAGGGGFLLVYCSKNKSKLISAMEKLNLIPMSFSFENEGTKIIFQS